MEFLRGLTTLILTLAGTYALFLLLVFATQERMLFLPFGDVGATPAAIGLPYEEVWLNTADGERLHGWYVIHPEPRGTLLFFHGNAGNISHRLESLAIFHRLRLDVFIFDYRGYGNSGGRPSEAGTYRDADAAWAHLVRERRLDPARIVLFGRSLGASIAAELGARLTAEGTPPHALILESGFTSVADIGAELYPFLPVRRLARLRYDTAAHLRRIDRPVLIVHSRDDEIIPFHHAERLRDAARGPATLLVLRGDHNRGFLLSRDVYVDGLDRFLGAQME